MSGFIKRCQGLIQSRGFFGFIKFSLNSIIRRSDDIVFDKNLSRDEAASRFELNDRYVVWIIDAGNVHDKEIAWIVQLVLRGENSIYRDGLAQNDCLVAITMNSELVHTSFIQFETSYKTVLNEAGAVPLIGNCWTSPDCRGQGLYPYAIERCCKEMNARGCVRIIISCAPDNSSSIAGISKSGFKPVRKVTTYLVLTKIMIQKLTVGEKSKYRFGVL